MLFDSMHPGFHTSCRVSAVGYLLLQEYAASPENLTWPLW